MGIRILRGGRKIDIPNVLVRVQALDAPIAHPVKRRGDGADHSELRFLVVGLIDDADRLPWLEGAWNLDARAMAVYRDRPAGRFERLPFFIRTPDAYRNAEHDTR